MSTTLGKLIVGGVVVIVLAGVLATIAFFFFQSQVGDEVDLVVPQNTNNQQSSNTSDPLEPPEQRPSPRLDNTFTFRNVFRPSVRPAVPVSSTVETSDTPGGGSGVTVPADTLFLQSVSVVDGAEVATLLWNGATFSVGEGDVLAGTPWQVLSIDGSSVVMLYGDSRVTLVVGQGVGK